MSTDMGSGYHCAVCEGGKSDYLRFPESSRRYFTGEVFQIKDSVWTPIEHALASVASLLRLSDAARNRSEQSLQSLMDRDHATRKDPRPCIVMADIFNSREGSKRPYVCLMATFDGTPIDEMPRIMRFFCVPVTPHDLFSPDIHLHSLPEWPTANGWIIAYPYWATRPLGGRWRAPNAGEARKGMAFGVLAMKELEQTCTAKHEAWKDMCRRNPVLANEYEREYRLHLRTWSRSRSRISSKCSGSSCKSWDSESYHCKKTHQRMPSRSILSHTLFENEVVDFHTKPTMPTHKEVRPPRSRKPSVGDKRSIASTASSRLKKGQQIISDIGRRFTHVRKGSMGDA
ncbi:hypothetical protein C8Q77DRAFT_292081 [Trametes polyzona]|nr:hypothetical protein C8Q77DRAFT_292081 [Trametes polyzona]